MVLNGTGLFFLTPVSPVPLYQTSFLTSINQSSDHHQRLQLPARENDPVLASFSNHARLLVSTPFLQKGDNGM
ncbi:Phosphate import ATP-binding protein PstB [Trichinella spiralis]|uniref:Phosphate import ATP-binding protein PstB n=1 Tax=Trichinella spiralis TaxID=6334 RepID=A0ABR3KMQ3_TRISP